MKDIYIKKYFNEENVTIYLHFRDEVAIRQIDSYPYETIFLSEKVPIIDSSFLYDQKFSDIEWEESDFISEIEFNNKWNTKNK